MRLRYLLLWVISGLLVSRCQAQEQYNYPYNIGNYDEFEGFLHVKGSDFHTGLKPYRVKDLNSACPFDSIRWINYHKGKFSRTLVGRKLFRQSLLRLDSAKYQFFVDPVLNLQLGWDAISHERLTVNTKGLNFRGSIGKRFSFTTSLWENQATFLPYMSTWTDRHQVVPGQGRIKNFLFDNGFYSALGLKVNGYDFAMATGHVSYSPAKFINIQLGHGKFFIGDGYRSMLLSDAGFAYPYLKISTRYWKFKYDVIFTQLQDTRIPVTFAAGFKKKWASFHYLSTAIGSRVQIGLFEGVVFNSDSTGNGKFNWNYLNPIILFRSVQYAYDGSGNNAVAGITAKVVPFNGAAFYGQLAIDRLDFTKLKKRGHVDQRLGWQLGFKVYHPLGIKRLYAQIEYNGARPYTYAGGSSLQNYAHYEQPLAHPLGANFHEVVARTGYSWHDLRFRYRISYSVSGRDTSGLSFGNDIYMPDRDAFRGIDSYGNSIGQGLSTKLTYQHLEVAYVMNRASHLQIILGLTHRIEKTELYTEQNLYLSFGIRTVLRNLYYDF